MGLELLIAAGALAIGLAGVLAKIARVYRSEWSTWVRRLAPFANWLKRYSFGFIMGYFAANSWGDIGVAALFGAVAGMLFWLLIEFAKLLDAYNERRARNE